MCSIVCMTTAQMKSHYIITNNKYIIKCIIFNVFKCSAEENLAGETFKVSVIDLSSELYTVQCFFNKEEIGDGLKFEWDNGMRYMDHMEGLTCKWWDGCLVTSLHTYQVKKISAFYLFHYLLSPSQTDNRILTHQGVGSWFEYWCLFCSQWIHYCNKG